MRHALPFFGHNHRALNGIGQQFQHGFCHWHGGFAHADQIEAAVI